MTFQGTVPVYNGYFIIAGSTLAESTFATGSDELCLPMSPQDSAVVICGAQQGDPTVNCTGLDAAPEPLTTVPDGWDEAMEVSINPLAPPLILEPANHSALFDGQPLLDHVGWMRIRVLARGRWAAREDPTLPEACDITAWPEPHARDTFTA